MKTLTSNTLLSLFTIILFTSMLFTQTTSIQLPTVADSNSSFSVLNSTGITRLRVNSDGGFYLGGEYLGGVIPKQGAGLRFIWYPKKMAFRAGYVDGTQWDDVNIEYYSMALGYNSIASGNTSTALGRNTTASGSSSIAMGNGTEASGNYSTATGRNTVASGSTSIAMGNMAEAHGMYSIAMGNQPVASGNYSIALGMGVNTNGQAGAFIFGDSTLSVIGSSAINQMTMRFSGGYRLFTNSACSTGVYMNSGAGSWTSVCDRNKKENFETVNGEHILSKIKEMPITKWNYKGTDPTVKYIGPVAQDFYSAFHLGGTDSLGINTLCIDGVNIAAIQALEKRTTELRSTVSELQKANDKIEAMQKSNSEMQARLMRLEETIASISANNSQKLSDK